MRVAVLICGHLRGGRDNRSLVKYLIEPNKAEVYIHTFPTRNVSAPTWHNDRSGSDDKLSADDLHWLRSTYMTSHLTVDSERDGTSHLGKGHEIAGYRWSTACAFALFWVHERHPKTDVVFVARPDLVLFEPFTIPLCEPGVVYGGYNKNQERQGNDGEVFWFGRPEVVQAMAIPVIPHDEIPLLSSYGMTGERMFTSIRKRHGFEYKPVHVKYALLRSWGLLEVEQ